MTFEKYTETSEWISASLGWVNDERLSIAWHIYWFIKLIELVIKLYKCEMWSWMLCEWRAMINGSKVRKKIKWNERNTINNIKIWYDFF